MNGIITCSVCYNHDSCSSMSSLIPYFFGPVHLVATFDSILGSMSLYINSISQSSTSFPFSLPNGGSSDFIFLIGSSIEKNEESFEGSFDEFRIWVGIIPSSTITSHYENGPTSDYTNPTSELCKSYYIILFLFISFSFYSFLFYYFIIIQH